MQDHYRVLESSEDANETCESPAVFSRTRKGHGERGMSLANVIDLQILSILCRQRQNIFLRIYRNPVHHSNFSGVDLDFLSSGISR